MTNAERTALADIYRAALQSAGGDDVFALCWRAAETDPQLESMLVRISEETVTIHRERN